MDKTECYKDSKIAWLLVLDRAREEGDRQKEREARRELRRLGVVIRFTEPKGGAA